MLKGRPCIRNLTAFKRGCPEKCWDGKEGCPAWTEMTMPRRDNPQIKETVSDCLDIFMFTIGYETLGLLEGNQRAIESFRNGLVTTTMQGEDVPKPDPAMHKLAEILENMKRSYEVSLMRDTQRRQIDQQIQEKLDGQKGALKYLEE